MQVGILISLKAVLLAQFIAPQTSTKTSTSIGTKTSSSTSTKTSASRSTKLECINNLVSKSFNRHSRCWHAALASLPRSPHAAPTPPPCRSPGTLRPQTAAFSSQAHAAPMPLPCRPHAAPALLQHRFHAALYRRNADTTPSSRGCTVRWLNASFTPSSQCRHGAATPQKRCPHAAPALPPRRLHSNPGPHRRNAAATTSSRRAHAG